MSSQAETSSGSDTCENCSSNFTLFKRKKVCGMCKQAFCQFCVNRANLNRNNGSSSNSNSLDRICVICQNICSAQTTTDDLMKLKLKHLRCILGSANVATNTCKDKRDLAELVMRNRFKINTEQTNSAPSVESNNRSTNNTQHSQQQQQQNSQSNGFNSTFNNFMNNVQDFVNFNINSVINNPVPAPAPSQQASSTTQPSSSSSSSSTTSNNNNNNRNTGNNGASAASSSSSTSTSFPSNLNSVFNIFGDQFPTVIQQTLNNNLFPFNVNNNQTEQPSQPSQTRENTPQPNRQTNPQTEARSSSSTATNEAPVSTGSNIKRRASLSDIKSEADIENLNIKQIKEILASNFVEFKGCCEKKELIDKVKRLYISYQENKRIEKEINGHYTEPASSSSSSSENPDAASSSKRVNLDESDLCKICMESLIDCVLLDCGHMCSCIKCGKQLAECPICRQNVVRVVRVFKS